LARGNSVVVTEKSLEGSPFHLVSLACTCPAVPLTRSTFVCGHNAPRISLLSPAPNTNQDLGGAYKIPVGVLSPPQIIPPTPDPASLVRTCYLRGVPGSPRSSAPCALTARAIAGGPEAGSWVGGGVYAGFAAFSSSSSSSCRGGGGKRGGGW
jgi:hypothetical protein